MTDRDVKFYEGENDEVRFKHRSAEKSRAEIERTLAKYGAIWHLCMAMKNTSAIVAFKIKTRQIKFISDARQDRETVPVYARF
ncbi:MAG: hypothetical protein U0Y68_23880 [Blastocatellia bacterium]